MPSKRTTTVVLTEKSREIKNRLAPGLGLKGILSVGLELFDKLSDTQKIKRVGIAITTDKKSAQKPIVLKSLADVVAMEKVTGVTFVLSKELQEWADKAKAEEAGIAAALPLKVDKHIQKKPGPLKAG